MLDPNDDGSAAVAAAADPPLRPGVSVPERLRALKEAVEKLEEAEDLEVAARENDLLLWKKTADNVDGAHENVVYAARRYVRSLRLASPRPKLSETSTAPTSILIPGAPGAPGRRRPPIPGSMASRR